MIFFIVTLEDSKIYVLTSARDREEAKNKAKGILKHDPDTYIVTPLTEEGARVHLVI